MGMWWKCGGRDLAGNLRKCAAVKLSTALSGILAWTGA